MTKKVGDLKLSADNPRTVTAGALASLEASMGKYGDLSGVIYNRRSKRLVGGHQRLKHFDRASDVVITEHSRKPNRQGTVAVGYIIREGERFAYREVDVDADTETEMNLRANVAAGAFDTDALRAAIAGLKANGRDLAPLGFDAAQLQRILLAEGQAAAREVPELGPPARPKSKAGTIYQLGRHRILAGDSTDAKNVARLLEGINPACVYTDPPYGVNFGESFRGSDIKNDHLQHDALVKLLVGMLRPAVHHARDDAAFYVWHASETHQSFDAALAAVGLQERQQLIWVKQNMAAGWADYRYGHEPCYYASKAGLSPSYYGDRTQSTAWRLAAVLPDGRLSIVIGPGVLISDGTGGQVYITAAPPKGKKVRHLRLEPEAGLVLGGDAGGTAWEISRESKTWHPTQKPIALAVRALLNSTKDGEWVYDGCAGSGNTLLAAEQTDRCAAVVELDLGYVDVVRQRFADLVQDAQWSPSGVLSAPPKADRPQRGQKGKAS